MKRIKEKLHSQTGASLLLALLFLLVCLTVGAVVLTAAATNAGRVHRNQQDQQAYLAVASAAQLVKEDFKDMKFVGTYYKKVTEYSDTETGEDGTTTVKHWTETTYEMGTTDLSESSLLAGDVLGLGTSYRYYDAVDLPKSSVPEVNYPQPVGKVYKADLSFVADHEMPEVQGAVYGYVLEDGARPRYTIVVVLYSKDNSNTMTMVFQASVNKTEVTVGGTDTVTTYTTTVTWDDPLIVKGAAI